MPLIHKFELLPVTNSGGKRCIFCNFGIYMVLLYKLRIFSPELSFIKYLTVLDLTVIQACANQHTNTSEIQALWPNNRIICVCSYKDVELNYTGRAIWQGAQRAPYVAEGHQTSAEARKKGPQGPEFIVSYIGPVLSLFIKVIIIRIQVTIITCQLDASCSQGAIQKKSMKLQSLSEVSRPPPPLCQLQTL